MALTDILSELMKAIWNFNAKLAVLEEKGATLEKQVGRALDANEALFNKIWQELDALRRHQSELEGRYNNEVRDKKELIADLRTRLSKLEESDTTQRGEIRRLLSILDNFVLSEPQDLTPRIVHVNEDKKKIGVINQQ